MISSTQEIWWITGASSGIGFELMLQLAAAGHLVYASARTVENIEHIAGQYPGRIVALACDVTDSAGMAALFTRAGGPARLDGVIMSAGTCEYVDAPALDEAAFRRVFDVNFFGIVNTCRTALPLLRAARLAGSSPQLIGIGSMSSVVGFPRAGAYGASKAAMHYLLDSLRCEIGHDIDVTVVRPGFVDTRLTRVNDFKMPWMCSAHEAAAYIRARMDHGRRCISFPWQLRAVLWLARVLPGIWYGHWRRRGKLERAA